MYNVLIKHELGSYVKNSFGEVFEIVQISINISFDHELMEDSVIVSYLAVDPRSEWGQVNMFTEDDIRRASDEEVDKYVLSSPDSSEYEDEFEEMYKFPAAEEFEGLFSQEIPQVSKPALANAEEAEFVDSAEYVEVVKERTTDEILDETLDYKSLIKSFGDEDGKYQSRIDELYKEFMKVTNASKNDGEATGG